MNGSVLVEVVNIKIIDCDFPNDSSMSPDAIVPLVRLAINHEQTAFSEECFEDTNWIY